MDIVEHENSRGWFNFVSVKVDTATLKSKLHLTPRGAFILNILLREYKVHWLEFHTSAYRQHLMILRQRLERKIGDKCVVSLGLGNYAVPDLYKELIRECINQDNIQ
jgi:hypothetical protein